MRFSPKLKTTNLSKKLVLNCSATGLKKYLLNSQTSLVLTPQSLSVVTSMGSSMTFSNCSRSVGTLLSSPTSFSETLSIEVYIVLKPLFFYLLSKLDMNQELHFLEVITNHVKLHKYMVFMMNA